MSGCTLEVTKMSKATASLVSKHKIISFANCQFDYKIWALIFMFSAVVLLSVHVKADTFDCSSPFWKAMLCMCTGARRAGPLLGSTRYGDRVDQVWFVVYSQKTEYTVSHHGQPAVKSGRPCIRITLSLSLPLSASLSSLSHNSNGSLQYKMLFNFPLHQLILPHQTGACIQSSACRLISALFIGQQ